MLCRGHCKCWGVLWYRSNCRFRSDCRLSSRQAFCHRSCHPDGYPSYRLNCHDPYRCGHGLMWCSCRDGSMMTLVALTGVTHAHADLLPNSMMMNGCSHVHAELIPNLMTIVRESKHVHAEPTNCCRSVPTVADGVEHRPELPIARRPAATLQQWFCK